MTIIYWVIGVGLVLWIGSTLYITFTVKEPSYTVVEKKSGYEIRRYDSYIVAETEVDGTYDTALNSGFKILADYIFGNNITMTAPVSDQKGVEMSMTRPVIEEKIAMTAPVLDEERNEKHVISFVMPAEYSMETLPRPNNTQINIKKVESKTVAVLRYGWYPTKERVEKRKSELIKFIERDGIKVTSPVRSAFYNAPFSFPLLYRNEVMADILEK